MEPYDPLFLSKALWGWQSLLILGILVAVGPFFLDASYAAVSKGIKEESWLKSNNKED